jgi:hypothetical protein
MNKQISFGMFLSFCNLGLYAVVLDLFFYSNIFLGLFHFDLIKIVGTARIPVGVIVLVIAVGMEIIIYRMIRGGIKQKGHEKAI